MLPSSCVSTNDHPDGVVAVVVVLVVTNISSRSPDWVEAGTVMPADVVFALLDATARKVGAAPLGSDTSTTVVAESVAPSSSVTVSVTEYWPEEPYA